jgi:hypothetical protein
MKRAVLLTMFFVGATIAGCIGLPDDDSLPPDVLRAQAAPTWESGQWWTYDTNVWGEISLVVFEDHGDYWHVETTNPELAWNHVDDPISFLGMIDKSNLAGSQEQEVRYFDFPLTEGKNWTTHWTGYDLLIEVKWINGTQVHLHGYHPDGWHRLSYDYDPHVGWFTDMVVYGEDHEAIYEVYYVDHGVGFADEVAIWDYARQGTISETNNLGDNQLSFQVPEEADELVVDWQWECGEGTEEAFFQVAVYDTPIIGDGETVEGECQSDEGTIVIPGASGGWTVRTNFMSLPEASTLGATAFTRTLQWAALGETGEESEGGGADAHGGH